MALGVGLGQTELLSVATAQDDLTLSEETANEIRAVNRSIESAREELDRQGRYVPATETANVTLILAGGGDAIADLESGNGVDPETFAALYAGDALPQVKQHLSIDDEDRLLYKNRVVRMYSKSRLKELYDLRNRYVPNGR